MKDARRQMDEANATISTAVSMLRAVKPTLLDPTLFNSAERRATAVFLTPIYRAALDFIQAYDTAVASATAALEKVQE